jgi:hypothetical protein
MDRAGLSHSFDPGGLKITVAKFYRPSGASTELLGVASDLVLPSPSDVAGISESTLVDPLPWDTVPAARYERLDLVRPYVGALHTRSDRRLHGDRAFLDLAAEVSELKRRVSEGTVVLNEAERRREIADTKARQDEMARAARAGATGHATYKLTVASAGRPGLPAAAAPPPLPKPTPATPEPSHNGDESSPADELIANESLAILGDYVQLLAPTPRHAAEPNPRPTPPEAAQR